MSVDLGLFINTDFNEEDLRAYLEQNYHFQADFMERSTVKGEINGVQIDCIAHCYPWLKPCMQDNRWRRAQLEDIAAKTNPSTWLTESLYNGNASRSVY